MISGFYSFPNLVEFDVLYWYIQYLLSFIRSLFPNHLHKLSNLHGNMMPKYTLLSQQLQQENSNFSKLTSLKPNCFCEGI